MVAPTIEPGRIKSGPGIIYYAPLGTSIPTFTASGSKVTGTWTSWLQVGATEGGLTFAETTETADIRVAESQYAVRTNTTGKSGRVTFSMSHIATTNWKLASNGGTVTTSGTDATKLDVYVPPLIGAEVRVMLGFLALDETEAIVWPQVFNVGGFETARSTLDTTSLLPVEFAVELPDPAVLTTPYKRWTAGSLADGT